MKQSIFFSFTLVLVLLAFAACGGDDEDERREFTVRSIDVSDFMVYNGNSEKGAEPIVFNNMYDRNLLTHFFKTIYAPSLYNERTIEFYEKHITYTTRTMKIKSDYLFRDDSLFVLNTNRDEIFVAQGTSETNLYYTRTMVRHPKVKEDGKIDTIYVTSEKMDLEKVLKRAGYDKKEDFKNQEDTIAWCNMIYLYN
ncbi:hypothetical protein [Dysgonomonas sp. 511]|uniref:hypothetical protein n=1 Tax=Dysgonomonas sp. 511 TaxID=2302930 RepID=UPI0013D1A494|nr:hypothetical protein [Dysgonomonas sp. 511]NDV78517.1 hypothetical protein [Dysgonomonas sp. 511]